MGMAREPDPVKLVVSVLAGNPTLILATQAALLQVFGPTDVASELLPFEHTDYYAAEFGPGLQRQILAFRQLIVPSELPAIKRQTNELEWTLCSTAGWLRTCPKVPLALAACEAASPVATERRRQVNIDPGYVSLGKLVLASTKDHAHRLYLGMGIYGEVTLTYQRGRFRPWAWTYPDYASERYCALFGEIRARYKAQLKERM